MSKNSTSGNLYVSMANFLTYYLLLGGNEANTLELFDEAFKFLSNGGIVEKKSTVFRSEAWGYQSEKLYFNQAIEFKTLLQPEELLKKIHQVETSLGRIRNNIGYEDRGIDIDILLFEDKVYESDSLKIPHPLLHQRTFALNPLSEICPKYMHPILQKTVEELLLEHNNNSKT